MKHLIYFIAIFFYYQANSQNLSVEYSVSNNGVINLTEMNANDSVTEFRVISADKMPSTTSFFIKNYTENKCYFTEQFLNIVFYVADSLNSMKWQTLPDTLTILGKVCNAATTSFRGRMYTAYYTPEIISNNGPWKFGGLPGLILYVKSDDDFVEWKATKINKAPKTNINISMVKKFKYIEWNDYVEKYTATVQKYLKLVKSNGTVGNGTSGNFKIDAIEIIYPALQTGKGIVIE